MQQGRDGAGPSNAPVLHRPAATQPAPFHISCLLEFQDARIEAAYQHYMYKMQQTADVCLIIINVFAVLVALVKQYAMPVASGPPTAALYLLSGSQSLALLALLLTAPAAYARHRGLIIGCTRMYRLAVWLLYLREPYPPRLFRRNLSLRLFLLSPAGGNVWLALFYPLPLSLHLLLLGLSSLVATWRSSALQERLSHLDISQEQLAHAYKQLSRFSKFFEMPSGRLLQRWPAPSLTDADRVWCMYAFVALVYGLLLPLLLLFIKEVHFRVRFLYCLRPAVSESHMNSLRNALYSITTAACFLTVTMVPCAWSLVQLASRYLAAQQGQLKADGVLFLLTVVSLEVFMRFWLLAVMQQAMQRVVRPGMLWLLLRMSGPQARSAAPLAARDRKSVV